MSDFNIEIGKYLLSFDRSQAMDLRFIKIGGFDLAPGVSTPEIPDPVINRALQGFMFTCGPDHIRQPCVIDGVAFPLHGSLVRQSVKSEPRIIYDNKSTIVSCEIGFLDLLNRQISLKRTYEISLSDNLHIQLRDEFTAKGEPHLNPMLMYHINLGKHLINRATSINGESLNLAPSDETQLFIHSAPEKCIVKNLTGAAKSIEFEWDHNTLPYLQTWKADSVISIEPASHELKPRQELVEENKLGFITPNAVWKTGLSIRVCH